MATTARSLLRSPGFWGVVGALALGAGAVAYGKRRDLRGSFGRSTAGPAPVVVRDNRERPAVTSRVKVGDMTLTRYSARTLPINQRVGLIQDQVWSGINDPRIRELALKLTRYCGRDDGPCEVKTIFDTVRKNVRYTGDIGPVLNPKTGEVEPHDYYQSPWRTWSMHGGDCDDHVALIATLLASIGHTTRLRVSAPSRWSDWAHIYVVAGTPKVDPTKWIAVDTTLEGRPTVGSEARYGKARDYVIDVPA